jgi:hypothetical protein
MARYIEIKLCRPNRVCRRNYEELSSTRQLNKIDVCKSSRICAVSKQRWKENGEWFSIIKSLYSAWRFPCLQRVSLLERISVEWWWGFAQSSEYWW